MDVIKILAVAIVGCVATVILNQYRPEFSLLLKLGIIGIAISVSLVSFADVSVAVSDFADELKINNEYILLLIKALLVSIACGVVSDICSDSGNKALSGVVELVGRLAVMLLSLPLLGSLMQLAKELIK